MDTYLPALRLPGDQPPIGAMRKIAKRIITLAILCIDGFNGIANQAARRNAAATGLGSSPAKEP